MNSLPIESRTPINSESQITFCNSPIHLRIQNDSQDTSILSAKVYLWVWNGSQNKVLGKPNFTLEKKKVSADDDYVNFNIADLVKSFLITPSNALNTNQPSFAYNQLTNPTITGQGVFWQIVADVTSTAGTVQKNYTTAFATLGYNWNYEQNAIYSYGIAPNPANKWYNPLIHNYISQSFNLNRSVSEATSANMINVQQITPPDSWKRCSRDPFLVVFLNKLGLWEMFTPNGKATISTKIESDTSNRVFRDPLMIDNSITHSKLRDNLDITQQYIINTGSLTEEMVSIVEQLIYSPKVYLIKFAGDIETSPTTGITVDSTYVTADDSNITVDNQGVTNELLGFYKTHYQIPVIITDSDFVRKTRVNDRNAIDYNIKFEETNNKINNIR